MTRISKNNLPSSIRVARKKEIAIRLFEAFILSIFLSICAFVGFNIGERIVDSKYSYEAKSDFLTKSDFLAPLSMPSTFIYSPFGYDKDEDEGMFHEAIRKEIDIDMSFNQYRPEIGKISQITWREDDSIVTPNAYRISIPHKLTRALNDYCRDIGITDLARNYILSEQNNIEPGDFRLVTLLDENIWYAQRPEKKWESDMHWISPANEKGHEDYLKVLRENGFLGVLNIIGNELGLDSLVAYHLTFIVVSHCEQGYIHHDTHNTGDRTFNVIIPLETIEDSPPELIIKGTDEPEASLGRLHYEEDIAIMLGDLAEHATSECDYRDKLGAMRLAATVYITDVNEDNVGDIASNTLTQIFPPKDVEWISAQRGRHWINAKYRSGVDAKVHFAGDLGRNTFSPMDGNDCNDWVEENPAFCDTDMEKRVACPVMCELYLDQDFFASNFSDEPWLR